jgi:hypothetical protein
MIADILKNGIASGEFSIDVSPNIAATMFYAGLQGLATRWILDGMGYSIKTMERGILDMLLEGIKKKGGVKDGDHD